MNLITLDEAKSYLRVDSGMDDELILSLLASAEKLSCDVARMNANEWKRACGEKPGTMALRGERLSHAEKDMLRSLLRSAVLYALGYLYEHREDADHHELVLTLRNILSSVREGVV